MAVAIEHGYDIVCFSHLRWDWVYQRPQHLLTRLARDHGARIFFVEEPLLFDDHARHIDAPRVPRRVETLDAPWSITWPAPNIVRCVPGIRADWPYYTGEDAEDTKVMRRLLQRLFVEQSIEDPVIWFYTPLALPLLDGLRPRAVVHDCMDELALFKGAPPDLRSRETALLRRADVVFAGGRSMYEARRGKHTNLHLFPSSVDAAHFAAATRPETPIDPAARPAPGAPTLGFYGVLDERLDIELLDAIAALRPDWQLVLVGPVVKIAPDALPRRPNLHYPGQRPYEALPGFLKGWDVCLMPFARNDATRSISPTKTLEFLAADKPIVSTPIPDVKRDYEGVVRFGADPAAFVVACEEALAEGTVERAARLATGRAVLAHTSWDATAGRMHDLLDAAVARRAGQGVATITVGAWRGNARPTSVGHLPSIGTGAGHTSRWTGGAELSAAVDGE